MNAASAPRRIAVTPTPTNVSANRPMLCGPMFQPAGREFTKEAKVKARISALMDYLEGIQQK
jgi:hypothetical protein